jgi:hypothetical protein
MLLQRLYISTATALAQLLAAESMLDGGDPSRRTALQAPELMSPGAELPHSCPIAGLL